MNQTEQGKLGDDRLEEELLGRSAEKMLEFCGRVKCNIQREKEKQSPEMKPRRDKKRRTNNVVGRRKSQVQKTRK
jgi:hypothetical protein